MKDFLFHNSTSTVLYKCVDNFEIWVRFLRPKLPIHIFRAATSVIRAEVIKLYNAIYHHRQFDHVCFSNAYFRSDQFFKYICKHDKLIHSFERTYGLSSMLSGVKYSDLAIANYYKPMVDAN